MLQLPPATLSFGVIVWPSLSLTLRRCTAQLLRTAHRRDQTPDLAVPTPLHDAAPTSVYVAHRQRERRPDEERERTVPLPLHYASVPIRYRHHNWNVSRCFVNQPSDVWTLARKGARESRYQSHRAHRALCRTHPSRTHRKSRGDHSCRALHDTILKRCRLAGSRTTSQ